MRITRASFVVAALVAGCSGASTPVSPDPPPAAAAVDSNPSAAETVVTVELRFDETVESEGLKLRWLELEDSRCPIGVTCVWAGQTVVTVEVWRGDEERLELELLRRAGRDPEPARALGRQLRLINVEPHPKEGITPARGDQVARIEIAVL